MNESFQNLKTSISQLEISVAEKTEMLRLADKVENEQTRLEFRYLRSTKDRDISINLLQETVNELEKQKTLLEKQSQQLSKNLHALEMSYNEMEQFAYIASHDLKSPLRNISGFSKLLKQRYRDTIDEGGKEYIDFIVHNTQMMTNVIDDLLIYSQIDHEKELAMTNFNRIVELVQLNLKSTIKNENAIITTDDLPTLWAHKSGIIRLFQNLVENAIKYRTEAVPKIHISAQFNGKDWQFSVTDNGVGLDEAYNDKAFQPFQRINQRDRPGMGMGLAICRKVAKLHGGNIWFSQNLPNIGSESLARHEATEGRGTTFYFTIPQIAQPML
jgi:two-component system, chemotaxis family, sensor kinase Cph1